MSRTCIEKLQLATSLLTGLVAVIEKKAKNILCLEKKAEIINCKIGDEYFVSMFCLTYCKKKIALLI